MSQKKPVDFFVDLPPSVGVNNHVFDAVMSLKEQSNLHRELLKRVFDTTTHPAVRATQQIRLRKLMDSKVPIRPPTADNSCGSEAQALSPLDPSLALRKFVNTDWPAHLRTDIAEIFRAYIDAGYIDIHTTHFPRKLDAKPGRLNGTLLQQVIESAPDSVGDVVVEVLLEAGSDLSLVPIQDEVFIEKGESIAVGKGDAIGLCAYMRAPASRMSSLVRDAAMRTAIARQLEAPGAPVAETKKARPRKGL